MDPDEQLSQDGPGAAGDIGPSQDSEEIAEVVGESDEQPVAAASAPLLVAAALFPMYGS